MTLKSLEDIYAHYYGVNLNFRLVHISFSNNSFLSYCRKQATQYLFLAQIGPIFLPLAVIFSFISFHFTSLFPLFLFPILINSCPGSLHRIPTCEAGEVGEGEGVDGCLQLGGRGWGEVAATLHHLAKVLLDYGPKV